MNVRVVTVLVLCSLSNPAVARERGLVERAKDRARAAAPKAKALASKVVRKIKELAGRGDPAPEEPSVGVRARKAMASLHETARAKGATQSPEKTSEWWEAEGRGVVKGQVSQMLSEGSGGPAVGVPTRSGNWVSPDAATTPPAPAPAAAAPTSPTGPVSGFSSLTPEAISAMPGSRQAAPPAPAVVVAPPAPAPAPPQQTSAAPPTSGFTDLGGAIRPAQPGSSVPQPAPVRASSGSTVPPGSEQISGYPATTKPSPQASPAPPGLEPVWTAASETRPEDLLGSGQAQIPGSAAGSQVQLMSAQRGRKPKPQASPKPAAARKGSGK